MNLSSRLLSICRQIPVDFIQSRGSRKLRSLEFQKLEPRVLLAGDVSVFIDANFGLKIIGDNADNQIQIIGGRFSSAQVIGLEGTTINGSDTPFQSTIGLRDLLVQMNGGNDEIDLHAGRFSFVAKLQGGVGEDSIIARNSNLQGLSIAAGDGNDLVQIDNVFAVNSSFIQTGNGNDVMAIYNHAAGDDIIFRAGSGNDTLAVDRMGMYDILDLDMQGGNDQILIAGKTFLGNGSLVELGSGDDFLGVLPELNGGQTQIQRDTAISAGSDNDLVAIDSSVTTEKGTHFNGNSGNDSFDNSGAALNKTSVVNFQNIGANPTSALDAVYTELARVGLDPTLFGSTDNFTFGIDINPTAITYTENDPPVALDAEIELRSGPETVVNSAQVAITGFVIGQDLLEFSDVGTVTGIFNDTTGILSFSGDGTLVQYQTALRSVRYLNTSDSPAETPRSLDVEMTSTEQQAAKASRTLNVFAQNDPPEIIVRDTPLEFDIDNQDLSRPIALDPDLTLQDFDTPDFTSATVQIIGGGQPGDTLSLATIGSISGIYDAATGLLALSGSASVAEYQEALRNVSFDSSIERAPLGMRTIQFQTTDGQTLVSGQMDLNVVASQTIGVLTSQSDLNYQETAEPTIIDPNVTLSTGGDPLVVVSQATVSITSGFSSNHDQLIFEPVSGIDSSYNQSLGILTFTGDASAENYESLLRSVKYFNSSFGDFDFSTADRVIEFAVQRNELTATATRTIQISEITSEQALIQRYLDVNDLTSEVTSSGLHYIVTQEGDGNFPNENSNVTVNYVGTLLNGQEFDANDDITFSLQQVIAGWTEGIPKFSAGGGGILIIPSNLAYGPSSPSPAIPPNSILKFDIDLLSFV
ncbi:MAG: FKBP-type peptidyl-prolyl cis-trans isomerase [Pirellulaceae bacterium]|nr:FKBP-type peptidyl-prolyl cis-trans isomerase [Pirellulaceae bacterium]